VPLEQYKPKNIDINRSSKDIITFREEKVQATYPTELRIQMSIARLFAILLESQV
jgi:hypothetical protein